MLASPSLGQSTTQPNTVDQATFDRAMERLKQRQAASQTDTVSPSVPQGVATRPDDVSDEAWREFQNYLGRERPVVAQQISFMTKENTAYKRSIVKLKAQRKPSDEQVRQIASYERMVEQNEQRIRDLRAGRLTGRFHGPNLDLERPKLHQIGYIGTGGENQLGLVFEDYEKDQEGKSKAHLRWERWGERVTKMDQVFTDRRRLYINGKRTNVVTESHEVSPGGIEVTDTVRLKTVYVVLHDPTFRQGVYPNEKLRRGMQVSISHPYQVTKIEDGRVELTLIDLAKLKAHWLGDAPSATQPANLDAAN